MKAPSNIEEYKNWLRNQYNVPIDPEYKVYYESVTSRMKVGFEASTIWQEISTNLREFNDEYYIKTDHHLLLYNNIPNVFIKPFTSFIEKTYRKNIIENENWPSPPLHGWSGPPNWFQNTNDLVRTFFTVKYLDGVEFLIDKITARCKSRSIDTDVKYRASDEGYYAAHLYLYYPIDIPARNGSAEGIDVSVEVQITTQLQEVIRRLLHKYYEVKRIEQGDRQIPWQWDYKSQEFLPNYLGHILHYIEGMIMEARRRSGEQ